jgi:hypothetical protein
MRTQNKDKIKLLEINFENKLRFYTFFKVLFLSQK